MAIEDGYSVAQLETALLSAVAAVRHLEEDCIRARDAFRAARETVKQIRAALKSARRAERVKRIGR